MFGIKKEKERMRNHIKKEGYMISTNLCSRNRSYNRGFDDGVIELLSVLAKSPTYYGFEIPKNATYGDVIMKVLESAGNYDRKECNGFIYLHEVGTPPDYFMAAFDEKLWNKPFKRGREE